MALAQTVMGTGKVGVQTGCFAEKLKGLIEVALPKEKITKKPQRLETRGIGRQDLSVTRLGLDRAPCALALLP